MSSASANPYSSLRHRPGGRVVVVVATVVVGGPAVVVVVGPGGGATVVVVGPLVEVVGLTPVQSSPSQQDFCNKPANKD